MRTLPAIFAHRGASFDAPENTLAAFALGWRQGADGIELDVHLSRDGEVIVAHDFTLKRTAGLNRRIDALKWAKIQTLDAGLWKGKPFRGEGVPKLAEVLAAAPPEGKVTIEVKGPVTMVPHLQRAIESGPVDPARLSVISFNYQVVRAAKRVLPECSVCLLAGVVGSKLLRGRPQLKRLMRLAAMADLQGLNLDQAWRIREEFVTTVHAAGLTLNVWTVNEPADAIHLARAGVDALYTDRPAYIRECLQASGFSSA